MHEATAQLNGQEAKDYNMNKTPDRDMEQLLRDADFSNPAHKAALHMQLFGDMQALEPDDLAMVAGGLAEPFVPPEAWPDKEMRHA